MDKIKNKKIPTIVIFGRTNVGKSTLFNCLTEKKQALVSPIEGTTRDSNIGKVAWRGQEFELVDTGGIMDLKLLIGKKAPKKEGLEGIEIKVQKQARAFLRKADLILFVVDGKTGLLPQDKEMVSVIKRIFPKTSHILYVVNKMDRPQEKRSIADFYKLGLGEPLAVSAATGSGTGDLLDLIFEKLKSKGLEAPLQGEEKEMIKICIVGQPNVGKSSLLNAILGEERVIVSPIPHTTREPQDTYLEYKDKTLKLIDTAGINKKGRQLARARDKNNLEKKGIAKTLDIINRADIALFVIDVNALPTNEDSKIIEEILDRKKSLVIIANKWDTVEERDTKKYTQSIQASFPFVAWAPIQFISAKTGEKVAKILDLILQISEERKKEITPSQLNTFMMRLVKIHRPSKGRGVKHPRIRKFEQCRVDPPQFDLRIGSKEDLHSSYVRFIENRLREKFGFLGTPITIKVTKNRARHGTHNN